MQLTFVQVFNIFLKLLLFYHFYVVTCIYVIMITTINIPAPPPLLHVIVADITCNIAFNTTQDLPQPVISFLFFLAHVLPSGLLCVLVFLINFIRFFRIFLVEFVCWFSLIIFNNFLYIRFYKCD